MEDFRTSKYLENDSVFIFCESKYFINNSFKHYRMSKRITRSRKRDIPVEEEKNIQPTIEENQVSLILFLLIK